MSLFEILLLIQVFVLVLSLWGIGSTLGTTNASIRELRALLVDYRINLKSELGDIKSELGDIKSELESISGTII